MTISYQNHQPLNFPTKFKAIPIIFLAYFYKCLIQFFDLINLVCIHLFAFITLLPMPIFDLINTITSKYSQAFSLFLQAYSDIKQMKNIPQNLAIISQCMLDEYSQGTSKCLNYYIAHEIDRIFLSLNECSNLESFYLSILPIMSEGYLNSEFFNEAWKYKKYFRLAKVYAERCLSSKIFNFDFADSLIESFPFSRESIVILCEMDAYLKHFKENNLSEVAISQINTAIKNRNSNAIELIEFIIFYEDKSSLDLLAKLDFKDFLNYSENIDISKDIPKNTETNFMDLEGLNNEFRYFFIIFKRIQSVKIRQKILELLPVMFEYNLVSLFSCANFIIECIKIDAFSVAIALNHYQESKWQPLQVYNLITKYYSPSKEINLEDSTNSSIIAQSSIKTLDENFDMNSNLIVFDSPDENERSYILSKIMNDDCLVDICLKLNCKNKKLLKSSRLFDLFLNKIIDSKIFSFLIFVNDSLILNNLSQILDGIEEKEDFCHLLWERLFNI